MSDLVGNTDCLFSHAEAHFSVRVGSSDDLVRLSTKISGI